MLGNTNVPTILLQPTFQDLHRWKEVVTPEHHQVDVVEVLATTEAVCQVVLRIHRSTQFVAMGTLKAKVTVALFADRTVPAKTSDR